jgi:hypothetical protein
MKSIATSRVWHPYAIGMAGAADKHRGLGIKLVTLHIPALKRRMILLKPRRMVWPADVACEHADLAL